MASKVTRAAPSPSARAEATGEAPARQVHVALCESALEELRQRGAPQVCQWTGQAPREGDPGSEQAIVVLETASGIRVCAPFYMQRAHIADHNQRNREAGCGLVLVEVLS